MAFVSMTSPLTCVASNPGGSMPRKRRSSISTPTVPVWCYAPTILFHTTPVQACGTWPSPKWSG